MPTRDEVFTACDALRAEGKPINQGTVRAALVRGGSNRDVGPLLVEWKTQRGYKARLETREMPEAIQARVIEFVSGAWEAARIDAAREMAGERERLDAKDRARDEVLAEVTARADAIEGENARLLAERDGLTREVERLRKRLDHIRAEEFWDRVMQEVHALIPPAGEITVEEVLSRLKPSVHRGARLHKEELNAATLRKKMNVRVRHNNYFEAGEAGVFRRIQPALLRVG